MFNIIPLTVGAWSLVKDLTGPGECRKLLVDEARAVTKGNEVLMVDVMKAYNKIRSTSHES